MTIVLRNKVEYLGIIYCDNTPIRVPQVIPSSLAFFLLQIGTALPYKPTPSLSDSSK